MTNSGSNKDTYASMSHINFFKNIVDGKPLEETVSRPLRTQQRASFARLLARRI